MTADPDAVTTQRTGFGSGRHRSSTPGPLVPEPTATDFENCFQGFYPRVLAYVLRRLPDRAAAEDIAAETFLIAWRRRGHIPEDPLPWLLTVARNVLHNAERSDRRQEQLTLRVAAEPVTDDARASTNSERMRTALAQLNERDQEVLTLITWDGLDRAGAASVLSCSQNTFAVRLHRARRRLASALASVPSTSEETRQ
jgi:RNA polymerase sigma factor (sigma-70 family)